MKQEDSVEKLDYSLGNILRPMNDDHGDFFLCDVSDAVLKDIMPSMEHPFFSLAKQPDTRIRRYRNGDAWIEIVPSVKGMPTIWDKDLLIYAISQLMHSINRGKPVEKKIRLNSYDFFKFTHRKPGGRQYQALLQALERLAGTTINTNIRSGPLKHDKNFHLVEETDVLYHEGSHRVVWVEIVLSDWVFQAIQEKKVLTLHKDYFRLLGSFDRRLYEIARKHVGRKKEWKFSIEELSKKISIDYPKRKTKFKLKAIAETNHLPDYSLKVEGDFVIFTNKGTMLTDEPKLFTAPLTGDVYAKAREAAPGWDVRMIEQEWRLWVVDKGETVKSPNAAFLGFCRKWFEKRGKP